MESALLQEYVEERSASKRRVGAQRTNETGVMMGRPSDETRFLSLLPEDGSTISNPRLRDQLGWAEDKYENVRERLVEKGQIVRGPGPGGTVRHIIEETEEAEDEETEERAAPRRSRGSDEDKLLSLVPKDGAPIGNRGLRERLGWDDDRYWTVRERLLEQGILAKGPGHGGSVRRVEAEEQMFLQHVPENGVAVTNGRLIEVLGWTEDRFHRVRERLIDKEIIRVPSGRGRGQSLERVSTQTPTPMPVEVETPAPRVDQEQTVADTSEAKREPAKHTKLLGTKPRIFIGSSVEGLDVAERIQQGLDHSAECTLWHQGVFGLSGGTLESLVKATKQFDFAVLVLTPDDLTTKRGTSRNSPRDNVLFELGLFMGKLGRERTFIVYCRDAQIDLPADLAGVTPATYGSRTDGNLKAALGPVCTDIKDAIRAANQKN